MSDTSASPQGRRILIAPVTGPLGERIQAWRRQHDPEQATRIPPHATLCYWAPIAEPGLIEQQVRHAFQQPTSVRLGRVHQFDNPDQTLYIDVHNSAALDEVRRRLFDGTFLPLAGHEDGTWHVTCVRRTNGRDATELLRAGGHLTLDTEWLVDMVSYLVLRGERYENLAEWHVG